MKKIAILTLYGYSNFGNRFQNYAVQQIINKYGYETDTLVLYQSYKPVLRPAYFRAKALFGDIKAKRYMKLYSFSKKHIPTKTFVNSALELPENIKAQYDFFVTGSDQVWNPLIRKTERQNFFLSFAEKNQRVCVSPSFGVEGIPEELKSIYTDGLNGFNNLCAREQSGVDIIKELTGREAELLIDPTLALTKDEWSKIFADTKPEKDYILVAMLGNLSKDKQEYIKGIAENNNLDIIDIFSVGSAYGPDEVLTLIDNACLVFTDSFHFTAFSINFKTPFVVSEREEDSIDAVTFSRIDSLLNAFSLPERKFGKTEDALNCDFVSAHKTLEAEREKFYRFIEKSLNSH